MSRYFYPTRGERVRVSNKEWSRRDAIQRAAIERSGKQQYRRGDGKVEAVDSATYEARQAKRDSQRQRWKAKTPTQKRRVVARLQRAKRLKGEARRQQAQTTRRYRLPELTIESDSPNAQAEAMAYLYAMSDTARAAQLADGRPVKQQTVTATVRIAYYVDGEYDPEMSSDAYGDLPPTVIPLEQDASGLVMPLKEWIKDGTKRERGDARAWLAAEMARSAGIDVDIYVDAESQPARGKAQQTLAGAYGHEAVTATIAATIDISVI